MIDVFTKLSASIPLKLKHVRVVANNLLRVFTNGLLGSPVILLSDQESEFASEIFEKMCKRLGITHKFLATYNPKANGTVERYNRTLINQLRSACDKNKEWAQVIVGVVEEYNCTPHSTTGLSPVELFLGRPVYRPTILPDAPRGWYENVSREEGGRSSWTRN